MLDEKYRVRKDARYSKLANIAGENVAPQHYYDQTPTPAAPGYPGQQGAVPNFAAPPQQGGVPTFDPPPTQAARGFNDDEESERGFGTDGGFGGREGGMRQKMKAKAEEKYEELEGSKYGRQIHGSRYGQQLQGYADRYGLTHRPTTPGGSAIGRTDFSVQLNRSCCKWSNGCQIEVSGI